ncbi:MAG: M48 family metalloprotease [Luminiphilus sp.]
MDFFREQEIARRNTRFLTGLFVLAVLALIAITNLLFIGLLLFEREGDPGTFFDYFDWPSFIAVGAVVAVVIGVVALVNWFNFARGGKQIANALGGTLVQPGTDDPLERRAANIVQEMALAANMPVPSLYVLNEEPGINAFAAGTSPANAVVAVTRGALMTLDRDQLQGVIGHEFSHILNGDMRLSIRLAAMLRGITFIGDVGGVLLRSSSHRRRYRSNKDDNQGALVALGLGLYLVGLLGGLMAGLIKSAISKQKEYLADASAVQFTRNPEGIGDALKVIGGYDSGTLVEAGRAEEMSHLFFGQVQHRLWSGFATHPPIEERIQRIDPDWDGIFLDASPPQGFATEDEQADDPGHEAALGAIAVVAAGAAVTMTKTRGAAAADVGERDEAEALLQETRDPLGAMALVLALAWDPPHEASQWEALDIKPIEGLSDTIRRWCEPLRARNAEQRLAVLELCLPALRGLSAEQYRAFRELLLEWINADGKTTLAEWCLFQTVRHFLDPEFMGTRPARPKHKSLTAVTDHLAIVLGTMAYLTDEDTDRAFNRGSAMLELPLRLPEVSALTVTHFSDAVENLAECYPLLKVSVLKAVALVAADDGVISDIEITLVKAMAASLDCPVPDAMLEANDIRKTDV